MIELEDEAEGPVAQLVALLRRRIVDALAVQTNTPMIRLVERAEQVQERALAAAGSADDAKKLAVMHLQIQPAQHARLDRVLAVGLVKANGSQQRNTFQHGYCLRIGVTG